MTVRILVGDCRETLKKLPDESVHCVVTSPPYFNLRDYGAAGQLGLEESTEEYIAKMTDVFWEVMRVMRNDAQLFLNISDTRSKRREWFGIPHQLVFALQSEGWRYEDEVVWNKPNCMVGPQTNRFTRSHEYVFMLNKSKRAYFDGVAVQEASVSDHSSGNAFKRPERLVFQNKDGSAKGSDKPWQLTPTRNRRTVWQIATHAFPEAHFATFPPSLVDVCIKAGTSKRGCCPGCGTPWLRVREREVLPPPDRVNNNPFKHDAMTTHGEGKTTLRNIVNNTSYGWRPSCLCYNTPPFPEYSRNEKDQDVIDSIRKERLGLLKEWGSLETVPAVVLDPFSGAGTTGLVADRLGRDAILLELNPEYAEMARKRIAEDGGMFTDVVIEGGN